MIGRLRGRIAERGPDGSCIVDVGGVGYECFVPLGTLARLPAPPEEVTLQVHTHVREEALSLYGFATGEDRLAFRTLLGVSNVGPKLALAVLSAMDAAELAQAVASGDRKRFQGISGVGKRTAERLLLELKDKLGFASVAARPLLPSTPAAPSAPAAGPLAEVADMLVAMGFKPAEADRALAQVEAPDGRPREVLLREALAHLR